MTLFVGNNRKDDITLSGDDSTSTVNLDCVIMSSDQIFKGTYFINF